MRNFNPGISLERYIYSTCHRKGKNKQINKQRQRHNHFFNILKEVNWKTDLLNLESAGTRKYFCVRKYFVSESTFYIKEK